MKKYLSQLTARFDIPLSANRCQHWDFIVTLEDGKFKLKEQRHVLGGGPIFHPKGTK